MRAGLYDLNMLRYNRYDLVLIFQIKLNQIFGTVELNSF